MLVQSRLRQLSDLIGAFIDRPTPGTLVIGCTDPEIAYVIYVLQQLDYHSPADLFFIAPEPFGDADEYLDTLEARRAALFGPPSAVCSAGPAIRPVERLHAMIDDMLARLPPGDHRLVCALVPARLDAPAGFSELAEALSRSPRGDRLRLVVRDDIQSPRHFTTAADSDSDQLLAYPFHLPSDVVVADTAHTAADPARDPDERAQAILQFAIRDLGFGNLDRALTFCSAAERLAATSALRALALVLSADVRRAQGDLDLACADAVTALRLASDPPSPPILHQAAMTLGRLSCDLEQPAYAAACFKLAEQSAIHDKHARAQARAARDALLQEATC
jgi:hypothetical protein